MYSLYIGSLCNIAFPMTRFTCIVTSRVRENLNAMKLSIDRGRENFCFKIIYIKFQLSIYGKLRNHKILGLIFGNNTENQYWLGVSLTVDNSAKQKNSTTGTGNHLFPNSCLKWRTNTTYYHRFEHIVYIIFSHFMTILGPSHLEHYSCIHADNTVTVHRQIIHNMIWVQILNICP